MPGVGTDALAVANALGFNSVFVDESVLLPEESLPAIKFKQLNNWEPINKSQNVNLIKNKTSQLNFFKSSKYMVCILIFKNSSTDFYSEEQQASNREWEKKCYIRTGFANLRIAHKYKHHNTL